MGANFNLSVKTFMPWNTKMYNYGRLRRALLTSLSLHSSLSTPLSLYSSLNPLTVYILQTPTKLTQRTIRSTHPFWPRLPAANASLG